MIIIPKIELHLIYSTDTKKALSISTKGLIVFSINYAIFLTPVGIFSSSPLILTRCESENAFILL